MNPSGHIPSHFYPPTRSVSYLPLHLRACAIGFILLSTLAVAMVRAESIRAIVCRDSVVVWDKDAESNCASLFVFDVLQADTLISIIERDTSMMQATCLCRFNLSVTLKGLAPGDYTVRVYRKPSPFYHIDTSLFIGSVRFTVPAAMMLNTHRSYQSVCNGSLDVDMPTAKAILSTADSVAHALRPGAKVHSIASMDVTPEGSAPIWRFRYRWHNEMTQEHEDLYFHSEGMKFVHDSTHQTIVVGTTFIKGDWFDSDSAMALAESQGGAAFRLQHPGCNVSLALSEALVPDSYPVWYITYRATESDETLSLSFDARLRMEEGVWEQQIGDTPENLVDIAMLSSTTAVAIGDRNTIIRTTDAGATWFNQTKHISATYEWKRLSFFDELHGMIVGDHRIVTTSDGGANWTLRTVPSEQRCLSALHMGTSDIYVGTDSGYVYHSNDTGTTWSGEKLSAMPILSLFYGKGVFIWGTPIYAVTSKSIFLSRVLPFSGWMEDVVEPVQGLGSMIGNGAISPDGMVYLVGVQGDLRASMMVLRKSVTDSVWELMELPLSPEGSVSGISVPDNSTVYVCGSSGTVFKTTNGGESWFSVSTPGERMMKAVSFIDDKCGYVVGDSGAVFYTANGGAIMSIDVPKEPVVTDFELGQNYPNPFNPTTFIPFSLRESGYAAMEIYDLLGRRVAVLVDGFVQGGSHIIHWDASGLPSGVYLCRLRAAASVRLIKLLYIR